MLKLLTAALLAAAAVPAVAAQVYDTPLTTFTNQAYGGTLGLNFVVNSTVTVTALGTYDSGRDGITSNIRVGIYDAGTGLFVTPVLNFNGTANGGGASYVTATIAPVVLTPGTYQLAAWGYDLGSDNNFNNGGAGGPVSFNTLSGALTALDASYGSTANPGVFATIPDGGTTRYGAGTFVASLGAVPEPATWGLMIAGFAMTGFAMRRRAAVAA